MCNNVAFLFNYGAGSSNKPILDTHPAPIAWGFSSLSSNSLYALEVRRVSDNAQTNIICSKKEIINKNSEVSTGGSLETWAGGSVLRVVNLYNQGTLGTDYDMKQANTAKQPIFVFANGTTELETYINFDSENTLLKADNPITYGQGSWFSVARITTTKSFVGLANAKIGVWSASSLYHHSEFAQYNESSLALFGSNKVSGFIDNSHAKSIVNISSNGSRYLQSVNADVSSTPNIVSGSDNGDWLDTNSSTGNVAQIGGFEYGGNVYTHGKLFEQILYGTEKNLTDTQFINTHRKEFHSI